MRNGTDISLTNWQTNASMDTAAELSFEQAFDAHHRLVYRYAAALTRDAALAEDVVQEVFVRLYQNFDDAQRAGQCTEMLRAWLLRVTANTARNVLRGRSRAQSRDESFAAHSLQIAASESPDEAMQRQSEIEAARNALAKLKEPMRSSLLLRHEGLSYKEIAEALDVREANVGSLLARARREFLRVYGKIGKS
jgi:RNA polymerase sigma factor (sigma-70 family)